MVGSQHETGNQSGTDAEGSNKKTVRPLASNIEFWRNAGAFRYVAECASISPFRNAPAFRLEA
jgi:hypothetical protein